MIVDGKSRLLLVMNRSAPSSGRADQPHPGGVGGHHRTARKGAWRCRTVMAWHLRNALGDALWRSEAGMPLADHRTPPQWVDDLAARFSALGIDPEAVLIAPG